MFDKKSGDSGFLLPKSRTSELVVQNLCDETLVYDLRLDKAHHLNEPVSFVWDRCDGKTSVEEIARLFSKKLKAEIETDFIRLALSELEKAHLLDAQSEKNFSENLSRRKILFRYAPVAVALPVVMSLVVPPSAHAQSCAAQGDACGKTCCPNLYCSPFENNTCQTCLEDGDPCNPGDPCCTTNFECLGGVCADPFE